MTQRIEGYARGLFEIARAEGNLDEVEDELFRFARSLETNEQLRSTLSDELLPAARRQAIVEDLLGGRATRTTTQLVSFVVGLGHGSDLPEIIDSLVQRAAGLRDEVVAEVRTAVKLTPDQEARLAAALANATGKNVSVRADRRPERARRRARHRRRHGHRRLRPYPTRTTQVPPLGDDHMAELTLSAADIAAAIKKNLDGFDSRHRGPHGRPRRRGRRRHRPCQRPARRRRQRAARVRGRLGRPRPQPRRGVDRRRRARRRERDRGGPDRQGHRPDPVGAGRRRRARPRRQRARRADRRTRRPGRHAVAPDGDPGARHHGPQARARAAADRHQGDRRHDADRSRSARADHRRPQDRQDHGRDRHHPQPARPRREVHLRRHRPEGLDGRPDRRDAAPGRRHGVHRRGRRPGRRLGAVQVPRPVRRLRHGPALDGATASTR